METPHDEKQEESNEGTITQPTTPIPIEMIEEDILSRLPVKSLLRCRSISKTWRSLISDPWFSKLHDAHTVSQRLSGDGSALLMYAYDSKHNGHLLSASHHGGEVTHLLTIPRVSPRSECVTAEHLNGLVLLASRKQWNRVGAVLNPSTRRMCKLPDQVCNMVDYRYPAYLFGFDETTNEHKVLQIKLITTKDSENVLGFSIFTLSTNSWRKIDVELPVGIEKRDFDLWDFRSVCVNNAIHLFLHSNETILTFDLRSETFSVTKVPLDAVRFTNFRPDIVDYRLFLMSISGLLGFVSYFHEIGEMHIWILKDYENEVWVEVTIVLPEPCTSLGRCFPSDIMLHTGEIIFTPMKVSRDLLKVPVCDMESKEFRFIEFTLGTEALCSEDFRFELVRCYYENIMPFPEGASQEL